MLDFLQQINLVNGNIIFPSSFYVCLFKVLKVLADSFLSEILSEQTRKIALLDMLFVKKLRRTRGGSDGRRVSWPQRL